MCYTLQNVTVSCDFEMNGKVWTCSTRLMVRGLIMYSMDLNNPLQCVGLPPRSEYRAQGYLWVFQCKLLSRKYSHQPGVISENRKTLVECWTNTRSFGITFVQHLVIYIAFSRIQGEWGITAPCLSSHSWQVTLQRAVLSPTPLIYLKSWVLFLSIHFQVLSY